MRLRAHANARPRGCAFASSGVCTCTRLQESAHIFRHAHKISSTSARLSSRTVTILRARARTFSAACTRFRTLARMSSGARTLLRVHARGSSCTCTCLRARPNASSVASTRVFGSACLQLRAHASSVVCTRVFGRAHARLRSRKRDSLIKACTHLRACAHFFGHAHVCHRGCARAHAHLLACVHSSLGVCMRVLVIRTQIFGRMHTILLARVRIFGHLYACLWVHACTHSRAHGRVFSVARKRTFGCAQEHLRLRCTHAPLVVGMCILVYGCTHTLLWVKACTSLVCAGSSLGTCTCIWACTSASSCARMCLRAH